MIVAGAGSQAKQMKCGRGCQYFPSHQDAVETYEATILFNLCSLNAFISLKGAILLA